MSRGSVWDGLGALGGLLSFAMYFAYTSLGQVVGPTGANPTWASAALAQALANSRDQARVGVYFGLAAAFLSLWFLGCLRGHLQHAEGEEVWMAAVL